MMVIAMTTLERQLYTRLELMPVTTFKRLFHTLTMFCTFQPTKTLLPTSWSLETRSKSQDGMVPYSKHTFVITAVNADGTFTLDKDCTGRRGLHGSVYKVQETIGSPSGTWESWPGMRWKRPKTKVTFTWNALTKACAIGAGVCECFDGYTWDRLRRCRVPK